ncbi:uncharacterized protein EKO05_0000108 [Ascochyta rabiei]|uniref:Uncharacterized protein n=1 Tax=Didymella rabiei TaxID=5454 RepID=A0A163EDJ6_DIDRA|nr:uncharacterized protein EKO05_0000108 [Ascochyta rabiei]KZM23647.1 hypothetical protein ST47_g5207 [Ascochyta rabiei]UPX09418.1 hypothetical protein EKO05_0000108 [Ascochyta rabiei]
MCRYTRIVWNSCDHSVLSSSPEHTLLCPQATQFKLKQGVHRAPASCFPLGDDLENLTGGDCNGAVVHTNAVFDFCDTCKENLDLDAALPDSTASLVEEVGEYAEDDLQQLAIQRDCLLACEQESLTAMAAFDTLSTHRSSHLKSALGAIRNSYIRTLLLSHGTTKYSTFFIRAFSACAQLLHTLDLYIALRVPTPLFSELFGLVGTKLQQAAKRLRTFTKLTNCLDKYEPATNAYEAAVNKYADKLAVRLGQPAVPDVCAFAHLVRDVPVYVQRALQTRECVGRHVIRELEARADRVCTPKAFSARERNTKGLRVNIEIAENPQPDTKDVPRLRNAGDTLEVMYMPGLETRGRLSPLGVGRGPWWVRGVLEQHGDGEIAREEVTVLSRGQTAQEPHISKLGGQSNLATRKVSVGPFEKLGPMLPEDTAFFGQTLSGSDGEVSGYIADDAGVISNANEDQGKDSALTTKEKKGWKRDGDGRMVKRKCSA